MDTRFARPVEDFPNQHRALSEQLELAAILCHVEQSVIGTTIHFLSPASATRSRAPMRKPPSGISGCASNTYTVGGPTKSTRSASGLPAPTIPRFKMATLGTEERERPIGGKGGSRLAGTRRNAHSCPEYDAFSVARGSI